MPRVIGITGQAGHGKDTVAAMIKKILGGRILSFADPLKNICKLLFRLDDRDVFTQAGICFRRWVLKYLENTSE